ncbi:hypothetical protein [Actinospongicola halichondriae]|uniref:hypothetical protein n=1 Tax=Actinospongicola halichondriae TaxID=3236844 RepID=UPI003D5684D3
MSRTCDSDEDQSPRLFVVFVPDTERRAVTERLPSPVQVVTRADIRAAVAAETDARSDADAVVIAGLEDELRSLLQHGAAAEAVHAELAMEQRRTLEAADWCEAQPSRDLQDAEAIASAAATLDVHGRAVREANRQLERVLEQRAAAEAALEEARSEIDSMGAAGHDETDVRRQMEDASRAVQAISAEYQAQMTEVARLKAQLWGLEDAMAASSVSGAPHDAAGHDSLQAMRAAVNAKFSQGEPVIAVVDPGALERARDDVAEAESRADAFAQELNRARLTLASLEREMTVRTHESDSHEARHAAALELESQVAAVERRLADAEVAARGEVEQATRAMSRAELALERVRQDTRDRRSQLRAYAALVPDEHRPPAEDDPVVHAAIIGRALRSHADTMQADLDKAGENLGRDRAHTAGKQSALDDRRARLGVAVPADAVAALERMAQGRLAIALDDAVAIDDDGLVDGFIPAPCLLDLTSSTPVIVLTADTAIVSWAIELPRERAVVTSVANLLDIGDLLAEDQTTP